MPGATREQMAKAGRFGGNARAIALSPKQRSKIARNAALMRWARMTPEERSAWRLQRDVPKSKLSKEEAA